jgi:hypothetical protein
LHATEADESSATGFVARHALAHIFFGCQFEMRLQFGVEFGITLLLVKKRQDTV